MFDPYLIIIGICIMVGLSYIYDLASKKFRVPSVLFLIFTGMVLNQVADYFDHDYEQQLNSILQLLGIIGLIMIVLEASVDLKLSRDKIPLISKSLLIAFLVLLITTISIAFFIQLLLNEKFFNALIYAIPLSVVSSAVLIPSVHHLTQEKKEFLIYESTFSDIIGIMFFNFIVLNDSGSVFSFSGLLMILVTIIVSFVLSYILVYFFCNITTKVKLFLMLAILALLYAIGKQLHLSSLLIILIFGLVLNNTELFFRGRLAKKLDQGKVVAICKDFRMITAETAFLVRTFFFVTFGMSINLSVFGDSIVLLVGSIIVLILYAVRYVNFKMVLRSNVLPEIFLAPRGLITILLFYSIPVQYQIQNFKVGILFFVILATSIIMMIALMNTKSSKPVEFTVIDYGAGPSSDLQDIEPEGPYCDIDGNGE
jgi:NhaP-type Na+/H+ or K+/H+ antiporter